MALELTTNFAVSTVATAPSPAASGTSLVVQAGHGARFPAGAQDFNAVVCPAGEQPTPDNAEIVRVTAISTDTFTITRQQEGTSARTIVVGDRIFAGVTAKTLADINTDINTASFIATAAIPISTVDAKGDLLAGTAADTVARLAAGSNEEVPIYDSGQSTGFKKAAPLGALKGYVPVQVLGMIARAQGSGQLTRAASTVAATASASGTANASLMVIPILASEMNISGRTTKLKTRLIIGTNGTAPAINFTAGLSLITASGGGADSHNFTWSTEVSSSTVSINTPGANTVSQAASSAFDLPADGMYVLVLTTSGALAATNPKIMAGMSLWMTHV